MLPDLAKLSKPVTRLVDRIGDLIEGGLKPGHLKRLAMANAQAKVIEATGQAEAERILAVSKATTELEASAIQRRGLIRFLLQVGREQANVESIALKALPYITDAADPDAIDEDWLVDFLDKCRLIGNEEMQSLWARILAQEANTPGQFSRRTISSVASMNKRDAVLFTSLYGFVAKISPEAGKEEELPLIYSLTDPMYTERDVHFESLQHLASIGFATFSASAQHVLNNCPGRVAIRYFDQAIDLSRCAAFCGQVRIGYVLPTEIGRQLAPLCGAQAVPGFFDYLTDAFISMGLLPDVSGSLAEPERTRLLALVPEGDDVLLSKAGNRLVITLRSPLSEPIKSGIREKVHEECQRSVSFLVQPE